MTSLRLASAVVALLWLGPSCVLASVKLALENGRVSQCQTLWAKQTVPVGSVCVDADQRNPEQLIVSYETRDGWKLDDAHLWIGRNVSDIPFLSEDGDDEKEANRNVQQEQGADDQPKKPNPTKLQVDLEQFPYKKEDLAGKHAHFGFVVQLMHLGYDCPDPKGTPFSAVAHATVTARSSIRNGKTPTKQNAWASAVEPIKLQGATMIRSITNDWQNFNFTVVCDIKNDPPAGAADRHFANKVPQ